MGRSSALKLLKRAMDFQCIKEVSGTLCADVIESKTANKAENKASAAVDAFAHKQYTSKQPNKSALVQKSEQAKQANKLRLFRD